MIRRIEIDELKSLYKSLIKKDFPRNERRPYQAIKKLHRTGRYACLVLEEEGRILAYASFILAYEISSILLDYFAVDGKYQGEGIGSQLLSYVSEYWVDKAGIIIECETPESARTENEKSQRERRINFYIRGGAINTPVRWRIFGVNYRVLWLPIDPNRVQPDVACDLTGLYSLAVPKALRPRVARILMRSISETIPKEP